MDGSESPLFFGEWLQRRRKVLDLTQAELAQLAGCSVFAVRKIESGERRPSKQLAELLAQALDIPAEEQDTFVKVARGDRALQRLPLPTGDSERAGDLGVQAQAPVPTPAHNLPVYLTPFVGREVELDALDRLLNDPLCRLLTLIGAGGIGKTRLAIEAADRQKQRFRDGVCFVPLAPLGSPAFLAQAIADALDITIQGQSEPRLQLLAHLSGRQLLLVLDNFEHLLGGVGLVTEILRQAPQVKVLTTSRERLNLHSEWVHAIQGLSVPRPDQTDRAEQYTSVELFVYSARRAQADFVLRDQDRPAVIRICRLVEGMPLSIELAAAWVSVLTCEEIAQEVERSFDFLATSAADVPERQRSQRAVFDHSWNLLSPTERDALSRLALFQGGFDRQAAQEVTDASLPLLLALVSKSLIRRAEDGRFDMHEAIRQYALSHLDEDPRAGAARERHGRYYLCLLADRKASLQGPAQREALRELKEEIDNLRAAWLWAVEYDQFSLIAQALRSLGWLCNVGVMYREGVEQIELAVRALRAREAGEEDQRVLGAALAQQGLLYFRQGEFGQALDRLEESLAILRPIGDPSLLTDPLVLTGVIMHLVGEMNRSLSLLQEGYETAATAGDRFYAAYSLYNLGYVAGLLGHYDEGYEQMMAGLAMWRQLGDPSSIALGLNYIALTAIHLGRVEEAQIYLEESLPLLMEIGDRWGIGTAYRHLGLAALARGDIAGSQSLLQQALAIFDGIITGWDVAQCLLYLAEATAAGDGAEARAEARDIYRRALRLAEECQAEPLVLEGLAGLAQLQLEKGEFESAYGLSLVVLDHPAATFVTRSRAGRIKSAAEERLDADQLGHARERAAQMRLQATIAALFTS